MTAECEAEPFSGFIYRMIGGRMIFFLGSTVQGFKGFFIQNH